MKIFILNIGKKSIPYQNTHNGILQDLKKSEPNSISLSCSSINYGTKENVLNYSDSYWISEKKLNSWFCITFNSKRVLLSGYLFRSFNYVNYEDPKSWKLLGSSDNEKWTQIDEQTNRDWITEPSSEVYFPVQNKGSFSHFKFIQTGKNYKNEDYFLLMYIELFGTIFSQLNFFFIF
jgi:hypothetical protein